MAQLLTKQNPSFNLILMRHSESAHNWKKLEHRNSHQDPNSSYKKTSSYLATKFSTDLIDPQEIDTKVIEDGLRMQDLSQIGLIITSPLNRCLTTVQHILTLFRCESDSKEQLPEVIVEPLLTSRVSTAWSVGKELREKKERFPSFNFQQFPKQQRHWILSVLNPDLVKNYKQHEQNTESILKFISEDNLETYDNVMKRIRKFKWKLQNKYLKLQKSKKILIVSHNCLFKYLVGTGTNSKGKVHSEIQFQHCDPIFFADKFVLNKTYLKPDQHGLEIVTKKQNCQTDSSKK